MDSGKVIKTGRSEAIIETAYNDINQAKLMAL